MLRVPVPRGAALPLSKGSKMNKAVINMTMAVFVGSIVAMVAVNKIDALKKLAK